MEKMLLVILIASLFPSGCKSATPSQPAKRLFRAIDFSKHPMPFTVEMKDVEVILQPLAAEEDNIEVAAAIRVKGYQPIIVKEDISSSPVFERGIGIGKLSESDPVPSILLTGFTGGAHCCATLRVVTPSAGRLRVIKFDEVDGEAEEAFPRDIDGDGTVDFERQDDRFRYQFASGAGSWSPPIFLNIYKGQIVDVSSQPSFKQRWQDFATQALARCSDQKDDDRNGACAAYVAANARLGNFASAMQTAVRLANHKSDIQFPTSCRVALVEYQCPAGKEIKFFTFESALLWFLKENKYLD